MTTRKYDISGKAIHMDVTPPVKQIKFDPEGKDLPTRPLAKYGQTGKVGDISIKHGMNRALEELARRARKGAPYIIVNEIQRLREKLFEKEGFNDWDGHWKERLVDIER